jgi:hypothetical protein
LYKILVKPVVKCSSEGWTCDGRLKSNRCGINEDLAGNIPLDKNLTDIKDKLEVDNIVRRGCCVGKRWKDERM